MIKIDLITGFLGSGKTTFLKKYANYLLEQGKKIAILENDFGAVNVDMLLLQDIQSQQCEVEMIVGGSDKNTHKRRLKTKLISMGMRGFDRVLVEPSGVFDVEEFFDVLEEEPLDRWYEVGNVIAIADINQSRNLSEESEYLLTSQIANAGKIILSKWSEDKNIQKNDTVSYLKQVIRKFGCERQLDDDILCKDWDAFTKEDYDSILQCGYRSESYRKLWFEQDKVFVSLYFMNVKISLEEFEKRAKALFTDDSCGNVIRVKGLISTQDEKYLSLNATRNEMEMTNVLTGQEIIIVIGEKLVKEKIQKYWE